MYTAQQNIAQCGHEEVRTGLNERCDVNRGNFLELISLRCKDIPWLKSKLELQLQKHAQWTSSAIQNELLTANTVNRRRLVRLAGKLQRG